MVSLIEIIWLGWEDSNLRMQVPKTCVLPLDDTPTYTKFLFPAGPLEVLHAFRAALLPLTFFGLEALLP